MIFKFLQFYYNQNVFVQLINVLFIKYVRNILFMAFLFVCMYNYVVEIPHFSFAQRNSAVFKN